MGGLALHLDFCAEASERRKPAVGDCREVHAGNVGEDDEALGFLQPSRGGLFVDLDFPTVTMCQIDPNVLSSSPVACFLLPPLRTYCRDRRSRPANFAHSLFLAHPLTVCPASSASHTCCSFN